MGTKAARQSEMCTGHTAKWRLTRIGTTLRRACLLSMTRRTLTISMIVHIMLDHRAAAVADWLKMLIMIMIMVSSNNSDMVNSPRCRHFSHSMVAMSNPLLFLKFIIHSSQDTKKKSNKKTLIYLQYYASSLKKSNIHQRKKTKPCCVNNIRITEVTSNLNPEKKTKLHAYILLIYCFYSFFSLPSITNNNA